MLGKLIDKVRPVGLELPTKIMILTTSLRALSSTIRGMEFVSFLTSNGDCQVSTHGMVSGAVKPSGEEARNMESKLSTISEY